MATLRAVVGAKIKTFRNIAALTQAELADMIEVDSPLIGRYERGVTMPSVENLIKLSIALKVSPSELLPGENDEIRQTLISLRGKISDAAMSVDSPEKLEKVLAYIKSLQHLVD